MRFAYRWGSRANGERTRYDPYVDAATAPLRRHLLGVRMTGVDAASKSFRVGDVNFVREVLTVEVYLAVAPEEPEWSAVLAPPWSTLPWTVLVLMEEAVTRGWAAFSQAEATRRGVPWLDLVRSAGAERQAGTAAGRNSSAKRSGRRRCVRMSARRRRASAGRRWRRSTRPAAISW